METELESSENAIAAAVAELKERFPRTLELYREVCILLFFRHGITPTANKLYQLVRKGSMSAPTEALNHFWDTLRERSRVTVEHADLPDELKTAAGDMVAAVWKTAQAMARDSIARLREEATVAAHAARNAELQAKTALTEAQRELDGTRKRLLDVEGLVGQLRQDLAAAEATNVGTVTRLEDVRQLLAQAQDMLAKERDEHAKEREKLAERSRLAEERFADMERRALVEIDRERTASAKVLKTLESERAAHATASERMRAEHTTAQATIGQLREQVGSLQNAVHTLNEERDRERTELQALRGQLETAIRQAAADSARAEQLRGELERHWAKAKPRPGRAAHATGGGKRQRKTTDTAGEQ